MNRFVIQLILTDYFNRNGSSRLELCDERSPRPYLSGSQSDVKVMGIASSNLSLLVFF